MVEKLFTSNYSSINYTFPQVIVIVAKEKTEVTNPLLVYVVTSQNHGVPCLYDISNLFNLFNNIALNWHSFVHKDVITLKWHAHNGSGTPNHMWYALCDSTLY